MTLVVVLISTIMLSSNAVYATERNLTYQKTRPYSDDNGDENIDDEEYTFARSKDEQVLKYSLVKIFDFDKKDLEAPYKKFEDSFYCLRGGKGFGTVEYGDASSSNSTKYTVIEDMKQNASDVIAKYKELYNINLDRTETITFNEQTYNDVNIYNSILWIAENSYLPVSTEKYNAEEYKAELLTKIGIAKVNQSMITDDDLETIQQLAFWYFANYDENGNSDSVSTTNETPINWLAINGNNDVWGTTRANYLNRIYQYFVEGALKEGADKDSKIRDITNGDSVTIGFDKNIEFGVEDKSSSGDVINPYENYYLIGPFKITTNDPRYNDFDLVLKDGKGNNINQYYYIEQTGDVLKKIKNFDIIDSTESTVTIDNVTYNQTYYIKLYKTALEFSDIDCSKFSLKVSKTEKWATSNLLYSGNDDQAVIEIKRDKVEAEAEISTETPKRFDLALRKFITAIKRGEENVEVADRTPKIDTTTLVNGIEDDRTGEVEYTATYTHSKTPLTVETGDIVTYTIRVYNEGEIDGTATEVTDYLPEGLELVSGGKNAWIAGEKITLANGSKVTPITSSDLKNKTIKAFDKTKTEENAEGIWQKADKGFGGVYYADLEVQCKVVATASGVDQSLRNIAAITADTGDDEDSVPEKPDLDNYIPPTDNSTYQEDDDDYEDLKLNKKEFDLSLRKFISKIERVNKETSQKEELQIASREPQIKIADLKSGNDTTAKYVHPKNTLTLKRGDIITYTIRVYNEGGLDGYVTEVKDYLPEGLELVEGENEAWAQDGNTLKTTSLKDKKLLAYNKNITSVAEGVSWQKAIDDNSGLYYYDLQVVCKIKDDVTDGAILKNVAEISADKSLPIDVDDRDSVPGDVYEDGKHNPGTEVGGYTPGEQDDDDFEQVTVEPAEVFDLALRKYIVAVNEKVLTGNESRVPNVNVTPLKQSETTATYKHKKDPVEVKTGDIVTYRFTVYNEGDLTGYVYSITDYLPKGLEFDVESNSEFIEARDSGEYTAEELEGKEYIYSINKEKNTITIAKKPSLIENGLLPYLFTLDPFNGEQLDSESIDVKFKVTATETSNDQVLTNVATMDYASAPRPQEEKAKDRDSKPTEFTEPTAEQLVQSLPGYKGNESNKTDLTDSTYHYEGQQDDDDFEKVIIKGKPFDLSLRKYITSLNGTELKDENDRTPKINTSKLNTVDETTGKKITTAEYIHPKDPVIVRKGDIVTYKIRVYNEGERNGYATEITDYLPEGLGFLPNYTNNSIWSIPKTTDETTGKEVLPEGIEIKNLVGENGFYKDESEIDKNKIKLEDFKDPITGEVPTDYSQIQIVTGERTAISTKSLNQKLIKAYKAEKAEGDLWQESTNNKEDGLFYQEVEITCIVLEENTYKGILKNVAEITEEYDENRNKIELEGDDIDSEPRNVYEDDKHTPGKEENGYTPGEQDDDDFEQLQLKYFDLALRKFITKVDDKEPETSREPVPDVTTLIDGTYDRNGKKEYTATYKHPKDPLWVKNGSEVEYTIRVYNEGSEDGYAYEISDDIPEGLLYSPENEVNKAYGWIMYREMTEEDKDIAEEDIIEYNGKKYVMTKDVEEATMIRTRYLERTLIKAFNPETKELSYADVKIVFTVKEPNDSKEFDKDRVIINQAQITEDSGDDEDSEPNKWHDEDDEDIEKVRIPIFDLSLLKWVTQSVVTVDGKTTITNTGFKPNQGLTESTGEEIRKNSEAEPIAKVEVDKKKLNKTVVKFVYKIRVTNEGEVPGYATEVTDYIPEGLEFYIEDGNNKAFGWVKTGDDRIVTRALETVLLNPGESKELEVTFRWINSEKNLGQKINIAEISEDANNYNTNDIDSIPNNKKDPYEKEQEDDDDFALVILSIKTGATEFIGYFTIITISLGILGAGIFLIKKYVLIK